MPRLDLVLALIRAGSSGDAIGVRSAVEAIATEESRRGHVVAAERLRGALAPTALKESVTPSFARAEELFVELSTKTGLDSLVLEDRARADLSALIREQRLAGKLAAAGLAPRHKVLLSGPPGNGKTSVAEAIAYELGSSLNVVSYGALVGSLLGETIRRTELLFTQAAAKPCVLFFDEFEALGKERADRQETGEMKRALASMLTRIDNLQSSVVVVAATNHPEMLDRAVWRRFEIKLVLGAPNHSQAIGFLIQQLNLVVDDRTVQLLGQCFPSSSYAELKDFALDTKRRAVLDAINMTEALRLELLVRFPEIDWPPDYDRSNKAVASPRASERRGKVARKAARDPRT
jgi:SpoVK/Ycf46/Vps4 family AAA+-type ATPase